MISGSLEDGLGGGNSWFQVLAGRSVLSWWEVEALYVGSWKWFQASTGNVDECGAIVTFC